MVKKPTKEGKPPAHRFSETRVKQVIGKLDDLAVADYDIRASDIVRARATSSEQDFLRLQRLVGVVWKEPFADAIKLPEPSSPIGARRAWELSNFEFDAWTTRTLRAVIKKGYMEGAPLYYERTPAGAAKYLEHELDWATPLLHEVQFVVCGKQRDIFLKAVGMYFSYDLATEKALVTAATAAVEWLAQYVKILQGSPEGLIVIIAYVLLAAGLEKFCSLDTRKLVGKNAH